IGTPQGNTRSTTEVSSFVIPEACRDTLNCKVFNSERICNKTGIYFPWATKNCPLYCGFCQAPTVTIACQDKLSNCNEYQSNLCIEPLYRLWREENCRKFCGICTGVTSNFANAGPVVLEEKSWSTTSNPSMTGASAWTTPKVCMDTHPCAVYRKEEICRRSGPFYQWSEKNCPLYCGFCQAPTITVPCEDKLSNCNQYGQDMCTNSRQILFREKNCRKYCNICSGTDSVVDMFSMLG
ncbi:uncharacterized protein LOC134242858, partial [Saccostrea cucullata]|uniref:uncharacterized protein LOC134242858 n=1 Tax=Saccostrea cuccullata TaxID=36930 RepID=UPI002ED4C7FE